MVQKARRVVVTQPNQVEIEEFDCPAPCAHEVLIATQSTLISPGTERAFYLALPMTNAAYPLYPGYSNIGTLQVLGDKVSHLQVGQRVASMAQHSSHAVLAAHQCLPVPDQAADEDAVFFNLIAIAMQAVHKARIELGESVVVLGAGLIGLFALQLARLAGGMPVIAVDRDEARLKLATKLGADAALPANDDLSSELDLLTQGSRANVVIEATGAAPAIPTAFQLAAERGRVILLGSTRGTVDGVDFYHDVHRKGLTIIGAHERTRPQYETFPGWWPQLREQQIALHLLAWQRIHVQALISHRYSWSDFPKAYEHIADWDSRALGMLINWQG